MKISPITNILTNPKAAEFAQNTICAISVETTLKALGRPTFIYFDKNANGRSKKYAATKELLYQSFCLGLYLGFINKVKKPVYKLISNKFFNSPIINTCINNNHSILSCISSKIRNKRTI